MKRTRGAAAGDRLRFDGWIAGVGTSSGARIVLGHWTSSPFGPFSDVMIERADGHRRLLAPTPETAEFIRGTYTFDSVRTVPVTVGVDGRTWTVDAEELHLRFVTARRGPLGYLLRSVPGPLSGSPAWTAVTDRAARLLLHGVRTRGSAGGGRKEWYGARDVHPIGALSGDCEGVDLGTLRPVEPPVRFGFGSVPRRPALTRITTTVVGAGGLSTSREW
ncbi:hypothetical protein HUT18_00305 [Streptomyces sp. NA04227]|uniref:hypothetical protein n=1 Tax=Streptomyces sp. NA04227 TaxID=2742136 RepID=UPI00158FA7E7|nr:hypothetical protein [Streptomyces sp. NA04227]QKW05024.1 hypothetical protein HUT18_00305 [Streptomyces sp. NA04227]